MELNPQVKTALKELPASARVPAFALKKIAEQIKKIYDQQQKETHDQHTQFLGKFKQIENKSSEIIIGRSLEISDLFKTDEYFTPQQLKNLDNAIKKTQKIGNYWLLCFKNSDLKNRLTPIDQQILKNLTNIQSTVDDFSIKITLTFANNSEWVKSGKYQRILKLNTNGLPDSFEGNQIAWQKQIKETEDGKKGFIYQIGTNKLEVQDAVSMIEPINFLVNQLIPYSISYYLGDIEQIEQQEGQEEDEFEEDEDDEESPQKKIKKE